MENDEYGIGYTSCYINDHPFKHVTDIPVDAAVAWVQSVLPNKEMGNGVAAKDLTTDGSYETDADKNGWLNKLFVIVAFEHGKFIALYNHDGKFSVRVET